MALVVKSNAHDKPPHPSIQLTVLCLWESARTQITYTQLLPHMQITPRGTETLEPTKNLLTESNHLLEGVSSKVWCTHLAFLFLEPENYIQTLHFCAETFLIQNPPMVSIDSLPCSLFIQAWACAMNLDLIELKLPSYVMKLLTLVIIKSIVRTDIATIIPVLSNR